MNPTLSTKPLLTIADIRDLEQQLFIEKDSYDVMKMAGEGIFKTILADHPKPKPNQTVHIVLGCGNNAGDGLVVAGLLKSQGFSVVAYQVFTQAFFGDAEQAFNFAKQQQVTIIPFEKFTCEASDIIVDAVFGIGLTRPAEGNAQQAIKYINKCHERLPQLIVYAVDVPSGLFVDVGQVLGDCVVADKTITFIADKIGLHTGDGKSYAGEVSVVSLGAEKHMEKCQANVFRYSYQDTHNNHPKALQTNQHKGHFGHALVIGGGKNLFGAAALSSVFALKVGVGKVSLLTHEDYQNQYHIKETPIYEVMRCESLPTVAHFGIFSAAILGPGLGRDEWGKNCFEETMQRLSEVAISAQNKGVPSLPLLIDADGLWHLASHEITHNQAPITVITPHEAEAARLLDTSVEKICADKITAVKQLAQHYQCIAVLKGAGTLISDGETVWINSSGNVNLATAGSGDVLAGIIGGHLAKLNRQIANSENVLNAVRYGVYQHGLAADNYAKKHAEKSLRASELWHYL